MLLDLNQLTPRDFENLIDDLYSDEGWEVEFHAGEGPDGGRDLVISRYIENSDGNKVLERFVVQCKRYSTTVNRSQVQDISDTITRYGAYGYVLAVTSDISEPLMQKLRDLTERGKICVSLRPFQIYDLIAKHEARFQKYFPDDYSKYIEAKRIIRKNDVLKVVEDKYKERLEDGEVVEVIHNLINLDIHTPEELKAIIDDDTISQLIGDSTREHLGRDATVFELVNYGTKLPERDNDKVKAQLLSYIRNTHEYLSRLRFRLYFDDYPISSVHFDQVYQHAFDFGTYHSNYKDGILEVMPADVAGYQRAIKLTANSERDFRLITLQSQIFRSKRIVAIDFNCAGFSEFFILVQAADRKLYFLHYINDEGTDEDTVQGDITYVNIHRVGSNNGPMLRQDMNFADDLKTRIGVDVTDFLGLYIGTKDEIRIYNILMQ